MEYLQQMLSVFIEGLCTRIATAFIVVNSRTLAEQQTGDEPEKLLDMG